MWLLVNMWMISKYDRNMMKKVFPSHITSIVASWWIYIFSKWIKICVFWSSSHQISTIFFFENLPNFSIGFQHVAKNVKVFKNFKLSYPVCSQIWINCVMDDHHFNDVAKMGKKEKTRTKNKTMLTNVLLFSLK